MGDYSGLAYALLTLIIGIIYVVLFSLFLIISKKHTFFSFKGVILFLLVGSFSVSTGFALDNFVWNVVRIHDSNCLYVNLVYPVLFLPSGNLFLKDNRKYLNKYLLIVSIILLLLIIIWMIAEEVI